MHMTMGFEMQHRNMPHATQHSHTHTLHTHLTPTYTPRTQVDAILSQPVAVTACSKTTGWLTQEQQQEVQHLLKERLDALFTTHIVKKRHASVGAGSAGEDGRKEGGRGGGGRGGGEEEEAMFISLADVGNDDGDGGG